MAQEIFCLTFVKAIKVKVATVWPILLANFIIRILIEFANKMGHTIWNVDFGITIHVKKSNNLRVKILSCLYGITPRESHCIFFEWAYFPPDGVETRWDLYP